MWIEVLPSMRSWTSTLAREMNKSMPQAGQQAGAAWSTAFSRSATSGVEAASAKLSASLRRVQDATGQVNVAEARLQQLRASGKATNAQLVAAEESLARARRNETGANEQLSAATRRVADAQAQHAAAVRNGSAAMDDGTKKAGLFSGMFTPMRANIVGTIAAFMGFNAVTGVLGEAVQAASGLHTSVRRTSAVFEESADKVRDWARGAAESVGLSERAALEAAAGFGNMFTQLGFTADAAADMSTETVQMAADLAAFNGLPTADVVERISAAFRGEYDSLQKVIPNISAARIETEALAATGKTNADALTAQEKAAAVLAIVQKDGTKAMGAFGDSADTLAGRQARLSAEWENAKARLGELLVGPMTGLLSVGSSLLPVVGGVADVAGVLARAFRSLPEPIQATIAAVAILRTGMALLNGPLAAVSTGVVGLAQTVAARVMAAAHTTAGAGGIMAAAGVAARAGWAGFVALLGGPVGLAIAGATLAFTFLSGRTRENKDATEDATTAQSELVQALMQSKGAIDANVRAAAAKEAQDRGILAVAEQLGIPLSKVTDAILGQGNALNEVGAKLIGYRDANTYFGTGPANPLATQANESWTALKELAGQTGGNIASAQQLAAATSQTGEAMSAAAPVTSNLTAELEGAQSAANETRQATDLLKLSLDILTGATVTMAEVEAAFYAATAQADGALENMNGTVLDGAGNLNVQSEAGRAAQNVLLGVRDSGNQLIATLIQQGATTDEVTARDAQLRQSFLATAAQMGITGGNAERLADQILGIPAERNTRITADTTQATTAARELQAQIDGLRGRVVTITARAVMPDLNGDASGSGRMGTFAGGGWTGLGGKYTPAGIVHANEYVEPRESVAYYGTGIFRALHRRAIPRAALAGLPGYAAGGPVPPVSIRTELDARVYEQDMNALAARFAKTLEPAMGFVGALQWARTQAGKPYIWGGVGPAGYDCSGFMSAITNVIRGRNPHSRVGSTASFPWPGFRPGAGRFTIGSTPNAGGGIGHMAGTLLGINVESGSGHGPMVGGRALGADNRMFRERYSLLDEGGLAPPGWWFNGTHDIERVLSPEQTRSFDRWLNGHDDELLNPHFNIQVKIGEQDITDIVDVRVLQRIDEWDERIGIDIRSGRL